MKRNTRPGWCLVVLAIWTLYLGSYGVLRLQGSLIRTGWFLNSRLPDGSPAPDAAWKDNAIARPAGKTGGGWLLVLFWPVIRSERLFWDTIGRQLRDPG